MEEGIDFQGVIEQLQHENEELREKLTYIYAHSVKFKVPNIGYVVHFIRENIRYISILFDAIVIVMSLIMLKKGVY